MRWRRWAREPAMAAFLAMLLLAGALAAAFPPPQRAGIGAITPRIPFEVPDAAHDADRDSYADDVDRVDGDALLRIDLRRFVTGAVVHPYFVVGTQADQWRTGLGAELEWRHIVDHDSLGSSPGSLSWQERVIRTGSWVVSEAASASKLGIGTTKDTNTTGIAWPQTFYLNIRDDRDLVDLRIEIWDESTRPDDLVAAWDLIVSVPDGVVTGVGSLGAGGNVTLTTGGTVLEARISVVPELSFGDRLAIAERWAPTMHFDSGEAFYPTRGEALERFHGFFRIAANLKTWDLDFNDGRDAYRLFLADFDGDGDTDRHDAILVTDILRGGDLARPTIYANVAHTTGGRVVVQYWFIYFYNFVAGDDSEDIDFLAHSGDREFVMLIFDDEDAARTGAPSDVVYSQHYRGIRIPVKDTAAAPLRGPDGGFDVFVGRGSHASFPVAGDDQALRPAFTGFYDVFDGKGATWRPGDYAVELLGNQTWATTNLWSPFTRYSKEIGSGDRPILSFDLRYSFQDPMYWAAAIPSEDQGRIASLYGGGR